MLCSMYSNTTTVVQNNFFRFCLLAISSEPLELFLLFLIMVRKLEKMKEQEM
jgi:hypothetical protein